MTRPSPPGSARSLISACWRPSAGCCGRGGSSGRKQGALKGRVFNRWLAIFAGGANDSGFISKKASSATVVELYRSCSYDVLLLTQPVVLIQIAQLNTGALVAA